MINFENVFLVQSTSIHMIGGQNSQQYSGQLSNGLLPWKGFVRLQLMQLVRWHGLLLRYLVLYIVNVAYSSVYRLKLFIFINRSLLFLPFDE